MDITGFFGKEVFRPIVITLVPGTFVAAPLMAYVHKSFEVIPKLVSEQAVVAAVLATALIIASGFLAENFGSWVEIWMCKRLPKLKEGESSHDEVWVRFLQTHFEKPPIGIHYLESIVLRLKFETSMIAPLGLLLFWIPTLTEKRICDSQIWGLEVVLAGIVIFLLHESYCGCKVLDKLRRDLLAGVNLK